MSNLNAAPSEEFVLHCDIPTCPAQLAMVGGVPRSEHGWGRLSLYDDYHGEGLFGARDYDLCQVHLEEVKRVLGR